MTTTTHSTNRTQRNAHSFVDQDAESKQGRSPRPEGRFRPRIVLLSVFGMLILGASLAPLWAVEPIQTGFFDDLAVKGYDTVAYFTDGKPVKGSKKFTHAWKGAEWRFASAEHRDLFAADPEKYAPQYGGYCAWAVSQGSTAGIDPKAWKIVDGKLYLNYSSKIQKKWEADIPGHIDAADGHWPKLLQ